MLKLRSKNVLTPDNLEEYIDSISCFDNKTIFTNPDELPQRIVAIGDIHGDLEALFSILLRAEDRYYWKMDSYKYFFSSNR